MRRGLLLLGLLGLLAVGLLPACGPGGHLDLDIVEAERAVSAVSAPEPAPITLGHEVPWTVARDRLSQAAQKGTSSVVLEERSGGTARRVTWTTARSPDSTPPDLHLRVVLVVHAGEECLDATIQGAAWTARYGCDAEAFRRIRGWGEEARPELGRLFDEAILAVASDPSRLAVRLDVSMSVASVVDWSDLYPLAEEAILCNAGLLALAPDLRGTRRARGAAETSLRWLAAHQAPDGRWSAAGFGDGCDGNPMQEPANEGRGDAAYDVGATGLVLLAYLGAGYTNRGRHPFAKTVSKGMRFLKSSQGRDGAFAGPSVPWGAEQHTIATLALVEIYGMTGSPLYRSVAQGGLDVLADGITHADLDVLAWTAAVYASARLLGRDAQRRGREPGLTYDSVRADDVLACCRDLSLSDRAEEVAVGLFGRILLGAEDPRCEALRRLAPMVRERLPVTGKGADVRHALFGSLALFQVGGDDWKSWNERLKEAVVASQRKGGVLCCYRGSWDPVGRGSGRFGRVGATALRALTVAVYYRYERVFGTP